MARELAGNSRAIIQLGGSGDLTDALVASTSFERPESADPPAG